MKLTGQNNPALAAWRWQGPLLLLLAARLAVGLAYSQVVPAWESFDEDGHFAYARYLAQQHSLLLRPGDPSARDIWEKFQPPLYYDLIAPVIGLFDLGPAFTGPPRNPYLAAGDAGVNYALHSAALPPAERSIELALGAGRAAGVVISTLSVVAVFLTARRLWPKEPATIWAATLLYAFWPQFLFVGSMVTNDVLITALSAVAVLLAVSLVLDGFRLRRALALSALVGAGLLTKLNGAALIALAGGALALSLAPGRTRLDRATTLRLGLGLSGLGLLVAAALWVLSSLNFVTRQVFQLAIVRDFVGNLGGGQGASGLVLLALPYAFRTFLASYGWGNLESFGWLYWLWTLGGLAAVAGFGAAMWRRYRGQTLDGPPPRVFGLLFGFVVTLLVLTLALAIAQQSVYLVPGRYLLPALPAVVMLLVAGWRAWLPGNILRQRAWQAVSLGLVLVGWLAPFRILAPAYARPNPATGDLLDTPVGVIFGDSLELLGYQGPVEATAGDSLRVTLCWQSVAAIPADDTLFLEVVGADGQGYGRLRTYPGHGNYPTSQWALNSPFCERYAVPIADNAPAPALAQLHVSWLAGTTGQPLPMRPVAGVAQKDPTYSLAFKVAGRPGYLPPIAHATDYRLGQQIKLTGYDIAPAGNNVRVTLRWQALEDGTANEVVFVHLRDRPDHAYGQADSLPVQGAYATSMWKKGEIVLDTHAVALPAAGAATPPLALVVGMYDVQTGKRLATFDANGSEVLNDEIRLADGLVFP